MLAAYHKRTGVFTTVLLCALWMPSLGRVVHGQAEQPLPWEKASKCIQRTKADDSHLKTMCNPYITEQGARVHQLRPVGAHSTVHEARAGQDREPSDASALMSVDMSMSAGRLAAWSIGNPHSSGRGGLATVVVERVPCAASGCCTATLSIRPNSTDMVSLKAFFVRSEYKFLLDLPIRPKLVKWLHRAGLILAPCRTILDVGGVGMSAVWLSMLYPEATVYRLEPNPSNFEIGVINALGLPNVQQFNLGLWDRNAVLPMCNMLEDNWGEDWPFVDAAGRPSSRQQGYFTRDAGACADEAARGVRVVLLSDFMRLLSIERFDLIKMDIESAEARVFVGDARIRDIAAGAQVVVAETHERFTPGSAGPMRAVFASLGYAHLADDENEIFLRPSLLRAGCLDLIAA